MRRLTGWFTRAGVVVAAGLSLGITGVVGETFAQSDPMKTDGVKKHETKQDGTRRKHNGEMKTEGMKKGEREKGEKATMKDDKMMKQDDTMMMEKKQ